jgi:hypothetical protein
VRVDNEVPAELERVLGRATEPGPGAEQSPVCAQRSKTPNAPPRPAPETVGAVDSKRLVCQHWIRSTEPVPEPPKVALPRKGDQRYGSIAKLTDAIAHGDRVLVARESGQMAMKDQQDGPAPVVRQSPPPALLVDQVNVRGTVARFHAHIIALRTRTTLWLSEGSRVL